MVAVASGRATIHLRHLLEHVQHVAYVTARWPSAAAREMALAVQYDWRQAVDPYGQPWPQTLGRGVHGRAIHMLRNAVKRWERAHFGDVAAIGTDISQFTPKGRTGRRRFSLNEGRLIEGGRLTAAGARAAHSKMEVAEPHRFDPEKHVMEGWQPYVNGEAAIISNEHPAAAALQRRYKGRPARLMHPIEGNLGPRWGGRMGRLTRKLLYGARMTEERRQQLHAQAEAKKAARLARRNAERAALGKPPLRPRKTRSDRKRVDRIVVRSLHG